MPEDYDEEIEYIPYSKVIKRTTILFLGNLAVFYLLGILNIDLIEDAAYTNIVILFLSILNSFLGLFNKNLGLF